MRRATKSGLISLKLGYLIAKTALQSGVRLAARSRRPYAMGLFDELPSAKRGEPETARDELGPDPKRHAEGHDTDPSPLDPSKSQHDKAPQPTTNNPTPADPSEALTRLANHMRNPKKFKRAAPLAVELMMSGNLKRKHGKEVFALLKASMESDDGRPDPKRSTESNNRFEYKQLFNAAIELEQEGVFNNRLKQKIQVYILYAHLVNELHTDDAFTFAKGLKKTFGLIDELPEFRSEPNETDCYDTKKVDEGIGEQEKVDEGAEGVSAEEAEARAAFAAQMRKAEFAAEVEQWKMEDDTREALIVAIECAGTRYNKTWAQTAIDMLVNGVHAIRSEKFSNLQQKRIVEVWDVVRQKRNLRKGGGGASEKLTSFDKASAAIASEKVSIRGGLGGEGTKDGRGESALR